VCEKLLGESYETGRLKSTNNDLSGCQIWRSILILFDYILLSDKIINNKFKLYKLIAVITLKHATNKWKQ